MRERNKSINIRVTESEKRKLQSNSRKANLSLSAYMIKCGLGQNVSSFSSD